MPQPTSQILCNLALEAAWIKVIEDRPPLALLGGENSIKIAMRTEIAAAIARGVTDGHDLQAAALACIPARARGGSKSLG